MTVSQKQKSKSQYLWVEAFRPQTINDMILPNEFKLFFKNVVESGEIPNLLLESSTPGSGKTSIAKAICAELNADYIYINISSEGGIDTLRTQIKQFASTKSFTRKPKIVIMDEADGATPALQKALRGFIEEFHSACRFILTCNYVSQIIPALREGRMMEFNFNMKDTQYVEEMKPKIKKRLEQILKFKSVEFDSEVVNGLVDANYPNMRKMICLLQKASAVNGKIDSRILKMIDVDDELFDLILAKKLTKARAFVSANSYSYSDLYGKMFERLVPQLPKAVQAQAILYIAEYEYRTAFSTQHDLQFAACILEIMGLI
jgi:DNA polymerase III delta prime subunit